MGKRKIQDEQEEASDAAHSNSASPDNDQASTKKSSKKAKAEKPKPKSSTKTKQAFTANDGDSLTIHTNHDGETYVDLGKKKRATVREFKGMSLVDIREFYGADGDEKPGKKGISLSLEQWEALKAAAPTIDALCAQLGKK